MKNKFLLTFAVFVFGFTIFSLTSIKVNAFSCNWVGGSSSDWSDTNNWAGTCVGGAGVPIDGDDVSIPSNTSTNNDIVGLTLNTLTFPGSPGGTLSGNDIGIITSIGGSFPHQINIGIILEGNASFSTNAYNDTVNLNGFNLTAAPSVIPWGIQSQITGTGGIIANDAGPIYLSGGGVGTKDIFASGDTQLSITGAWPFGQEIFLYDGAALFGPGIGGSFVYTDGTANYSPSRFGLDSPEYMSGGEFDFAPGDTVSLVIGGTTAGTTHDAIFNYGFGPDLTGVTLSLSLTYTPSGGDTYTLLSADGGITGTFSGLPDGSLISIGNQDFIINYTAGSVVLSAVGGQIYTDNPSFTANPPTPTAGQSVTITAVIGSNFQIPTGTAEFFDGATSLRTVAVFGGNAVITIPGGLSAGSHSITFVYSGDILHGAFVSNPLILNVAGVLADTGIDLPIAPLIFSIIALASGAVLIKRKF